MSPERISVAYIIESLAGIGGAERQMVELIRHLDRTLIRARVLSYCPGNYFADQLEEAGVPLVIVPKAGRFDISPAGKLATWLRSGEVDLIHAYLYTSSFYAVLARVLTGRGKAVASERCALFDGRGLAQLYMPWTYRHADLTIANSASARECLLKRLKLDPNRVLFIPNGFDLNTFCPARDDARTALRAELGWDDNSKVVLTVAHLKEQKNHIGILDALDGLYPVRSSLRFCWAGIFEPQAADTQIRKRIARSGLQDLVQIMGPRRDVINLYRASDVLLLNSFYEGTPNAVLEALACGCPVLATDVSDVARYVLPGKTGWLIPPGDVSALRRALQDVAEASIGQLREMGRRGRQHLVQLHMDPASLARSHEAVYVNLVNA